MLAVNGVVMAMVVVVTTGAVDSSAGFIDEVVSGVVPPAIAPGMGPATCDAVGPAAPSVPHPLTAVASIAAARNADHPRITATIHHGSRALATVPPIAGSAS